MAKCQEDLLTVVSEQLAPPVFTELSATSGLQPDR